MTSRNTDRSVEALVETLLRYQRLQIEAFERDDIRTGNRHFDKLSAALEQLANTPPGRDALERLMQHEMPEVCVRAAGMVIGWAPDIAIPVLGRLMVDWRPKDTRKGYFSVGGSAKMRLYRHFGIRTYHRNDLIEPLRRYGIELRRLPDEIWT